MVIYGLWHAGAGAREPDRGEAEVFVSQEAARAELWARVGYGGVARMTCLDGRVRLVAMLSLPEPPERGGPSMLLFDNDPRCVLGDGSLPVSYGRLVFGSDREVRFLPAFTEGGESRDES